MKVKEISSIPSTLRLSLTLIIILIVISSPAVMLVNPALIAAPLSKESSNSGTEAAAAPSTISQEGGRDFIAQAPLQIPRTLQSNDLVNSLAFYEVTFITSTTGAIDKIRMDFPAGTGVGAAGIIERIGIGGGTLLKSGSSITYDVTSPVSIPAGTFIRLEMFGIKNPITPSTTFTADITTRDSAGNLIDGPSQTNVYTIKKVGSSDIADSAVTSSKIASGAITPGMPNDDFLKRVTVTDTLAGNDIGWNPDGATVTFTIEELEISFTDNVFFIIEVTGFNGSPTVNHFCDVVGHETIFPNTFTITCFSAPPDGSELHYVVGNLFPSHKIIS